MGGAFARGREFAFGRAPPAPLGRGGSSGDHPWLTGRGAGQHPQAGSGRIENDFPTFQEQKQAEQQRIDAIAAKEKAEKMAQAAQEAYNLSVLERLKGFSGQHSVTGGINWDELVRRSRKLCVCAALLR